MICLVVRLMLLALSIGECALGCFIPAHLVWRLFAVEDFDTRMVVSILRNPFLCQ